MTDEEKPVCKHQDKVLGEYIATGENLLGQIVSCEMEKIRCILCLSESVRRKI